MTQGQDQPDYPQTRFSKVVETLLVTLGLWTGMIWLLLLAVIMVNVIARYWFAQGFIEFEELQWHLYSTGFLIGLTYAFVQDAHVRVDVLHQRWSAVTQAWIELYGIIIFLMPFLLLVIYASVPLAQYSFNTAEISQAPGGLPLRWLIKGLLPVSFILLLVAALARLTRVSSFLFNWPCKVQV